MMPYRTPEEYEERYKEVRGRDRALLSLDNPLEIDEQFDRKVITSSYIMRYLHQQNKLSFSILDIGCGQDLFLFTWLTKYLKIRDIFDIQYTALDIIKDEVILEKVRDRLRYIKGTWLELEKIFHDEKFDIIIWLDGPEHEPNSKRVYRQINKILKPDGIVIISAPINCPAWGHAVLYTQERFRLEISRFFNIKAFVFLDDGKLPECIVMCTKKE